MIIYLHGFRSAPASIKASRLREYMQARGLGDLYSCPQLPVSPKAAIELIDAQIARCSTPPTLVGSSLGGYYATSLAERHGLRAVMVNPSVFPYLTLASYVGQQTNLYTELPFEFAAAYVDELKAIEAPPITRPKRYWLLVEKGDETLDYREAVARYPGARQTVLDGGDHGFSRWTEYLDGVLEFAGITAP